MSTITGGKRQVPFMIDNNPSMVRPQLFGQQEIIRHLFKTYGPGESAIPPSLQSKGSGTSGKGARLKTNARPDNSRMKPLTLYGWEGISFVKVITFLIN